MKKINLKTKILLFVVTLIMFSFFSAIIINKVFILSEKSSDYLKLSSERQELYNKFMISNAKIIERTTGTEPFNKTSISDLNGNDVSANDNYVRTLDKVGYVIEVAISSNNIDNKSSKANNLTGGVIKIKAKLPNQEDVINLTWEADAWMQNVSYNEDKTEIMAEYYINQEVDLTRSTQELSFSVLVGGYKTEITPEMLPEFEVWMEGNSPDNDKSSVSSQKLKDEKEPFMISGKASYDISLFPEYGILQREIKEINGQSVEGRYKTFGIGVALKRITGMPDFRGVEYPSDEFNINLALEYQYTLGSSSKQTITSSTTNAIDILNGTQIQAFGINGEPNDNYIPNTKVSYYNDHAPYGKLSYGNDTNSVYNSGNLEASLTEKNLNISFKDFEVKNLFPSNAVSSTYKLSENTGYFLSGNVELFIPFYGSQTTNNQYYLNITAESANYKTIDNIVHNINKGSSSISDSNSSDNTYIMQFGNKIMGNYTHSFNMYNTEDKLLDRATLGEAAISIDEDFYLKINHGLLDYNFEGGTDVLLMWDANMVKIREDKENNWLKITTKNYYNTDNLPSAENVTISFGIYTSNKSNGLTSYQTMNNATYNYFTWYNNYEEAQKNGVVTAVYINDPDIRGNGEQRDYYLYFNMLDKESSIGKTAIFKKKIYAYTDSSRTNYFSFGTESYSPTIYNENGQITTPHNNWDYGKTVLATSNKTNISIKSIQNGIEKEIYDVEDEIVDFIITPTMTAISSHEGRIIEDTYVYTTLPNGLEYIEGSSNKEPEEVLKNSDGSTKITWLYKNWEVNTPAPEYENITFSAEISSVTINNTEHAIKAIIFNKEDKRNESQFRTDTQNITIVNLSGSQLSKKLNKKLVDIGENISVTTIVGNSGRSDLENARVVEVLPKNNESGSIINGSYSITISSLATGQKMYYSTKNIENLDLTYENGKYSAQNTDLTSADWIEIKTGDIISDEATVIVSCFSKISSSSSVRYIYSINTDNNIGEDKYYFTSFLSSDTSTSVLKNNTIYASVIKRTIKGSIIEANESSSYSNEISVKLLDKNNQIVDTAMTKNHKYEFTNIKKGEYYISFTIPTNYIVSNTLTNKANENGITSLISDQNKTSTEINVTIDNIDMVLKRKEAILNVKHLEFETNKELASAQTKVVYYGDRYSTSVDTTLDESYQLYKKTDNYEGIVTSDNIEVVYYYYNTKNNTIKQSYTIDSKDEINKKGQKVNYKLNYKAEIKGYIGDVNIALTDKLEYDIDEENSNLDGGIYNPLTKTITWTLSKTNIDSLKELQTITISKNINVIYKNMDIVEGTVASNGEGSIVLENDTHKVEAQNVIFVDIKGKIIVHHYYANSTEKISEDITIENTLGKEYTSEPVTIEGYKIVSNPLNKTDIFKDEDTEIIYEYERIVLNIKTKVSSNRGGIISGAEQVYYGEDSTPNNLVIKADDNYIIKRISINGIEYNITNQKIMVLNTLKNITEDQLVEVDFEEELINPDTSIIISMVSIISLVILLLLVFIVKKAYKQKLQKI